MSFGTGDLVAGRGFDCDLVLDDSLVSRRHAVFRQLDGDEIEVEDLGSRNGILVNDVRIEGPARLRHGDRVKIGSQLLVLKDLQKIKPRASTSELSRCPACNEFVPAEDPVCRACGARLHAPSIAPSAPPRGAETLSQRPSGSFAVLAQLVDKVLGLGRFDEAERVLTNMLGSLLSAARGAEPPASSVDPGSLATAAHYALRLADALGKPAWLDQCVELYTAAGQLMPAPLIDELYRIASKVHYTNPRPLRAYVARLKSDATELGPAGRFLLQRLEGLERRVVSG